MSNIRGVCVITVGGTVSMLFPSRSVMEGFVKNLQNYLDNYENENEVRVFSFADGTYPIDDLRNISKELKDRFS